MTLADHPCFAPGNLGVFTRGTACVRLDAVLAKFAEPQVREARMALGDCHSPVRRGRALSLLQSLPAKRQAAIMAAYWRSRREAADRAAGERAP